jgi:hypothetical protein
MSSTTQGIRFHGDPIDDSDYTKRLSLAVLLKVYERGMKRHWSDEGGWTVL